MRRGDDPMRLVAIDVEPALYCGTYAKYNNGRVAGKWLKLRDYPDAEAFLQACRDLHRDEADPELMFQDYEGLLRDFYGESLSLADLETIYRWVMLDDDDRLLVSEYLDVTGSGLNQWDIDEVHNSFFCKLDRTNGESDAAAFGGYLLDNGLIDVPDHLQGYVDIEALGRDWLMDLSVSGSGYVFEV